jgi:hypothetical protein
VNLVDVGNTIEVAIGGMAIEAVDERTLARRERTRVDVGPNASPAESVGSGGVRLVRVDRLGCQLDEGSFGTGEAGENAQAIVGQMPVRDPSRREVGRVERVQGVEFTGNLLALERRPSWLGRRIREELSVPGMQFGPRATGKVGLEDAIIEGSVRKSPQVRRR